MSQSIANGRRRRSLADAAAFLAAALSTTAIVLPVTPAHAFGVVFDPSNYAQNVLTAARTLQAINQQIQQLQNEATMITQAAKNLSRIDFPQLQALRQKLQVIDRLMAQARGIDFRVANLDQQFARLFPEGSGAPQSVRAQIAAARERLATAMAAYRQTMGLQAQVVENVQADAQALSEIVEASQGAEGGLQVGQATNQLLALTAKQQFQIQQLLAAQFRAHAIEAAKAAQAGIDARAATRSFLGSGTAYTPR